MLKIEIATDNAAFHENQHEIANVMQRIVARLAMGETEGKVLDSNGNTVGTFRMEAE